MCTNGQPDNTDGVLRPTAHAVECVDEALRHGTMQQKRKKIVELVNLFERVR